MNVHEMQDLKNLAERLDLPITFQIAATADEYYHNADMDQVLSVNNEGRMTMVNFLKQQVAQSSLFDALAYYYAEVVENLQGAPTRGLPCPFTDQGLLLNPDASLQYCHNSRPIGNALATASTALYHAPGKHCLSRYRAQRDLSHLSHVLHVFRQLAEGRILLSFFHRKAAFRCPPFALAPGRIR